mgnify:CR=1 FL=1
MIWIFSSVAVARTKKIQPIQNVEGLIKQKEPEILKEKGILNGKEILKEKGILNGKGILKGSILKIKLSIY